jgi:hypothetical protein
MSIFNYYPYINYDNQTATHILNKAEVLSNTLRDQRKFFKYTIKNGERADIIAYREYGDSTLDWIIYIINNIIDPYKDWPLSELDFKKYIEKKYNKNAELMTSTLHSYSVAYYYYNGLTSDTQEEIAAYNYTITKETYDSLSAVEQSGWVPKSIWDYENEINESKRDIVLLRAMYVDEFRSKFKDLFING